MEIYRDDCAHIVDPYLQRLRFEVCSKVFEIVRQRINKGVYMSFRHAQAGKKSHLMNAYEIIDHRAQKAGYEAIFRV